MVTPFDYINQCYQQNTQQLMAQYSAQQLQTQAALPTRGTNEAWLIAATDHVRVKLS